MEIELIRQVNSRWSDGRTFAGMPGRRHLVPDDDTDAVAHMRHLIAIGDARDVTPVAEDEPAGEPPEMADKITKPGRKATATKVASDE